METIFDHNPTDEELNRFGGREQFEWERAHGIDPFANPDDANFMLGLLFSMRDDKEKANFYFAKVKNRSLIAHLFQDF